MKWTILFPTMVLCILLAADELRGQVEVRDSIAISRMLDTTVTSTQLMKSLGKVKGVVRPPTTLVLPFDGKVRITIEGGASAAIDDVILRSPIEATIFYNANAHHGETWVSEEYPQGTVFDIGLYWHDWWSQSGWESDAYVEQVDDTTFIVFLEDIGMGDWDVILRVTMVQQSMNINIQAEPAEVYPTHTGQDANNNNRTTITVSVTRGSNNPVSGHSVQLEARAVERSGGHDHDGNRPAGTLSATEGQTGEDGKFVVMYTASEFGGIERIIARSTTVNKNDSVDVTVRVPNLLLFGGAGSYQLTGANDKHQNNHYFCSQAAIDSLISVANQFSKAKWNTSGAMRLNDMSLEWGGLFDLDTLWSNKKGHNAHRIGKSVDIENLVYEQTDTVSQKTGNDTTLIIPKVKWVKDFVKFMETEMQNWSFVDEGQIRSDVFKRTRKYPHFEWKGE